MAKVRSLRPLVTLNRRSRELALASASGPKRRSIAKIAWLAGADQISEIAHAPGRSRKTALSFRAEIVWILEHSFCVRYRN